MRELSERIGASLAALGGVVATPDLRRIQVALAASELGGWVSLISLGLLSYDEAGLLGFGLAFGLRMLPPMIAAPFMGVLADRFARRDVMLVASLGAGVLMGASAVVVLSGATPVAVYVFASATSIAWTALRPAHAALLPSLARTPDRLTAANAVTSMIESVASFAGPAIGGVVVAVAGPGVAYLLSALLFASSALLVLGVIEPTSEGEGSEAREAPSSVLADLGEGVRAVVLDSRARLLVALITTQVFVSAALLVLLAALSFDVLGSGEAGFGLLLAALGAGGVFGSVSALGLIGRRLGRSIAFATLLWSVPIMLLAATRALPVALALAAVVGFANTLLDVASFTLLQRAVSDNVRARVFGILESLMYGATAAGMVAVSLAATAFDPDLVVISVGLVLPLFVALGWRALQEMDTVSEHLVEKLGLLRGVPFLALLPPPVIEHLADALERRSISAGSPVTRQGAQGDAFFIVEQGAVHVSVGGVRAQTLGVGAYFGEIALLRDVPRTATVVAASDVTLLELARDDFLPAVTGHDASARVAGAIVAARLAAFRATAL